MADDEVTVPEGEPDKDWSHAELDTYAELNGVGPLEGTKREKVEQLHFALSDLAPEFTDHWADGSLTIPMGATGPTVMLYRERLGLDDGSDQYDARMRSRVRTFQRSAGLPETGRLDPETRRLLG